jgi:hypothetical protein
MQCESFSAALKVSLLHLYVFVIARLVVHNWGIFHEIRGHRGIRQSATL